MTLEIVIHGIIILEQALFWKTSGLYIKKPKIPKSLKRPGWLARLVTYIPGRYEQTVRYHGWYSKKSRVMRKMAGKDDTIPAIMQKDLSSKESRQNWAHLIQKIYEADPLICLKCQAMVL